MKNPLYIQVFFTFYFIWWGCVEVKKGFKGVTKLKSNSKSPIRIIEFSERFELILYQMGF